MSGKFLRKHQEVKFLDKKRLLALLLSIVMLISMLPTFAMSVKAETNEWERPNVKHENLAEHLIILQTFGGGQNQNATPFSHSFIELYNPTAETVDLTGWKVAYYDEREQAGRTSYEWDVTLSGTLAPGCSFLIRGQALTDLIDPAYEIEDYDISLPDNWLDNNNYEVTLLNPNDDVVNKMEFLPASAVADMNKRTVRRRISFTANTEERFDGRMRLDNADDMPIDTFNAIRPRSTEDGEWGVHHGMEADSSKKGELLIGSFYIGTDNSSAGTHSYVEIFNPNYYAVELNNNFALHYKDVERINGGARTPDWLKLDLEGTIPAFTSFLVNLGETTSLPLSAGGTNVRVGNLNLLDKTFDQDFKIDDEMIPVSLLHNKGVKLVITSNQDEISSDIKNPFTGDGEGQIDGYEDMVGVSGNDSVSPTTNGFEIDSVLAGSQSGQSKQRGFVRINQVNDKRYQDTNNNALDFISVDYRDIDFITNSDNDGLLPRALEDGEHTETKISTIISLIDAIPAVENITLADKSKVETAREAYTILTLDAEKALITNYAKLTAAELKILELENPALPDEVSAVITAINEIPAVAEITLADKSKVDAARTAYDALATAELKALVTNYSALETAEAKIVELETDKTAADAVIALIENLPAVADLVTSNKTAVDTAAAAFDAISESQKLLVPENLRTKLQEAVTKMATIGNTFRITFNHNYTGPSDFTRLTQSNGRLSAIPNPTARANYQFNGWWTQATGGTRISTTHTFNGDVTVHARWVQIFTVTFRDDSKIMPKPTRRTVTSGSTVSTPAKPGKKGFTFIGWYTASNLKTKFRFGNNGTKITGNTNIFAKWERNPVKPAKFSAKRSGKRVNLKWSKQAGARIEIQRRSANGKWVTVRTTKAGASSWKTGNLKKGSYTFRIRARKSNTTPKNSSWATSKKVTVR